MADGKSSDSNDALAEVEHRGRLRLAMARALVAAAEPRHPHHEFGLAYLRRSLSRRQRDDSRPPDQA